jgi:prevent-host-death family protein
MPAISQALKACLDSWSSSKRRMVWRRGLLCENVVSPPVLAKDSTMPNYNVHEAKSNLSQLLKQAAQGEEVIVMRDGEPVAKLVRYRPPRRKKIELGWAAGQVRETPGWEKAMTKEQAGVFMGTR